MGISTKPAVIIAGGGGSGRGMGGAGGPAGGMGVSPGVERSPGKWMAVYLVKEVADLEH